MAEETSIVDTYMNTGRELAQQEKAVRELLRERACDVNEVTRSILITLGMQDYDAPEKLEWRTISRYARLIPYTQVDDYIGIEGSMQRGLWTVVHKKWLAPDLDREAIEQMVKEEFRQKSITRIQGSLEIETGFLKRVEHVLDGLEQESPVPAHYIQDVLPFRHPILSKIKDCPREDIIAAINERKNEVKARIAEYEEYLDTTKKIKPDAWVDYALSISIPIPRRTRYTR